MQYKNYIFDLYGTLLDVSTNEEKYSLWKYMADLYACYGTIYTPNELKRRFQTLDLKAREEMCRQKGVTYSEIKLEKVFLQLYKEKATANELTLENESLWANMIANTFRVISRKYVRPYPKTLHVLKSLKENGCKIYLLSNAQAVFTRPEIHLSGIEEYFDIMYLSSDFDIKKPEKQYLQLLLDSEKLKPEESVMIGNEMESDVKIADLCGIDGIFINLHHEDSKTLQKRKKQLEIQQDFAVIEDIGEVLNY